MEIQDRKRKIDQIDNEELDLFVAMIQDNASMAETEDDVVSVSENDEEEISKMKKTRRVYSKEVKTKAVELVRKFGVAKVSEKSNIPESNLKRWQNDQVAPTNRRRGRKIKHPDLEEELLMFITEKRTELKATTSRIMTKKAKQIAVVLNIKDMKFTWSWFLKFLNRNRLVIRSPTTKITKSLSTLKTAAEAFIEKFKEFLNNRNILISSLIKEFISSLSS
jgi:transposase-like protein